ncbi:hypothetical protein VNO78_20516 [Psophocarpus tetragonolobus]|uniref:Uncharacterized protein n=1 Tax=Psophocarpus tetragonolobus TaxID=3891 RepID=A0AAN9S9J4_PSOTE
MNKADLFTGVLALGGFATVARLMNDVLLFECRSMPLEKLTEDSVFEMWKKHDGMAIRVTCSRANDCGGTYVSRTIAVDQSGKSDFHTIQAAIDFVPTNNNQLVQCWERVEFAITKEKDCVLNVTASGSITAQARDSDNDPNGFVFKGGSAVGPGANTSKPVPWMKKLSFSDSERQFSKRLFINHDDWLTKLPLK